MPRKTMKPPFSCLFFCSAMGCERSQGGVERITPVMEAPSLKHWATREVPKESIFLSQVSFLHFFFHENIPLLKDRIFLNIFEWGSLYLKLSLGMISKSKYLLFSH